MSVGPKVGDTHGLMRLPTGAAVACNPLSNGLRLAEGPGGTPHARLGGGEGRISDKRVEREYTLYSVYLRSRSALSAVKSAREWHPEDT
jgi:hypothetical protein